MGDPIGCFGVWQKSCGQNRLLVVRFFCGVYMNDLKYKEWFLCNLFDITIQGKTKHGHYICWCIKCWDQMFLSNPAGWQGDEKKKHTIKTVCYFQLSVKHCLWINTYNEPSLCKNLFHITGVCCLNGLSYLGFGGKETLRAWQKNGFRSIKIG